MDIAYTHVNLLQSKSACIGALLPQSFAKLQGQGGPQSMSRTDTETERKPGLKINEHLNVILNYERKPW